MPYKNYSWFKPCKKNVVFREENFDYKTYLNHMKSHKFSSNEQEVKTIMVNNCLTYLLHKAKLFY